MDTYFVRYIALSLWVILSPLLFSGIVMGQQSAPAGGSVTIVEEGDSRSLTHEFVKTLRGMDLETLFSKGHLHTVSFPMQPDSAMMYYSAAISREAEAGNDSLSMAYIAKSMINSAYVCTNAFSDVKKSYKLLRRAERICESYGMKPILAHVYLNLSEALSTNETIYAFHHADSIKRSDLYLEKAFLEAEESENPEVMAFSIYNMANNWLRVKDELLMKYMRRYLNNDKAKEYRAYPFVSSLCEGILALNNGHCEKALPIFEKMEDMKFPFGREDILMRHYSKYLQGIALEKMGQPREALGKYLEIQNDSTGYDHLKTRLWGYQVLAEFFDRNGDSATSDKYKLNYYTTLMEMESSGLGQSIKELELGDKVEDYEKELSLLSAKEKQQKIIIIGGTVFSLLAIGILLLVLWFSRRKRRYVQTLYEKNLQLQAAEKAYKDKEAENEDKKKAEENNDESQTRAGVDDNDALVGRIVEALETTDMIFNPEFQMANLCAEVGSNPTYVSKYINAHYGKNFKSVLTELRVKEACRRLDNPTESGQYTIEAICQGVGFKSRAAFSVAFKNLTGLTPTEYRNAAKKYSPR